MLPKAALGDTQPPVPSAGGFPYVPTKEFIVTEPTSFPGPEDVEPARTPDPMPTPDPADPATDNGDTAEQDGTEEGAQDR